MAYFDLVIIYLACGAPFGVYELTITRSKRNVPLRGLTAALIWPLFAVRHLKRYFEADTRLRDDVQRIRTGLEREIFSKITFGDVFEFREAYQRFTGLAAAVMEQGSPSHELFIATDHPDPRLASVCLTRRNRTKLDLHLKRSRQDLIRLIYTLQPDRNLSVAILLKELGTVVGSSDLANERLAPEVSADAVGEQAAVQAVGHRAS
jgi:hypothetical protein